MMASSSSEEQQQHPLHLHLQGSLLPLVSSSHASLLRPLQFFVAWQGVLTIAYTGFPPPLSKLKENLGTEALGIIKENPGSMWPKTSLACVKDNKRLSMMQLMQLRKICSEESCHMAESLPIFVDSLSLVVYGNCCLESVLLSTKIPLRLPVDEAGPTANEAAHVQEIVGAFAADKLEEYYFYASKDGNRSAHYRHPKAGVTLAHFLSTPPAALKRFRAKIEAALPGLYDWFTEESLHITIRALI